ncbi:helix-turn-helix transcriptional regulator [Lacticaseibacillus kribbianus]|uniref:helix-turn-helix transcriptional regulator n=1 Tax=Lacticaseibacillus kribbianus TaxID=2926292 RepID=UPI001CD36186|nr:AraC family transcriptional regulator [Lacticaseibacillus kribbianus]
MPKKTLRELEPHGTTLFPLRVHEFESDALRTERVPAHWHPECELLVVTQGQAALHVDGTTVTLGLGDIALLLPDQLHAITAPVGPPFAFYAVVFDPVFVRSASPDTLQQRYLDPVFERAVALPVRFTAADAQYRALRRGLDAIRAAGTAARPGYELQVKAQLYLVWAALWDARQGPVPAAAEGSAHVDLAKAVMATIRTHYAEPLTLTGLADSFNLSKSHLCRIFKAATKATVTDYLNDQRIDQAQRLLATTATPIGEIAGQVGFNNISYFNKLFLRRCHQTPRAYRAAQQG